MHSCCSKQSKHSPKDELKVAFCFLIDSLQRKRSQGGSFWYLHSFQRFLRFKLTKIILPLTALLFFRMHAMVRYPPPVSPFFCLQCASTVSVDYLNKLYYNHAGSSISSSVRKVSN